MAPSHVDKDGSRRASPPVSSGGPAMTWLFETFFVLAAALAFDRLVGDPAWVWRRVPHPVVLAGRAITWFDQKLNREALPFAERRRRGIAVLVVLAVAGIVLGWTVELVLRSSLIGLAIEAVVAAVFFAQKSLIDHVANVGRELETGSLERAQLAVADIVGRDVTVLDESAVARAAIESAAENFSDGVVAPAFWFLLLGLPGLLLFKVVSTADSMIGYRSPRYEAFGWASARFDDVLNYVPARLSALLLSWAALLSGRDGGAARRAAVADASRHKSPNAGWPEAALAGALGLALGGPRRYGETAVDGAWLNEAGRAGAGPADIRRAIRLIDTAWAIMLVLIASGATLAAL
jgi:adenosylcobinamide-phosphate synthase